MFPIPSAADRARAAATTGPGRTDVPGIELADEAQWRLLSKLGVHHEETAKWLSAGPPRRFKLDNTWFAGADAV